MIITGIGSRKIDASQYKVCAGLARLFADNGWHLRSGGAIGADSAWEQGFIKSNEKTIFLPEPNFNNRPNTSCYPSPIYDQIWFEAEDIARSIHPRFDLLTEFAQSAHTRNIYQILGSDLKTKSDLVVVCAPPKGRSVTGGTATAFNLAKAKGIPVFNVWLIEDRKQLYSTYVKGFLGYVNPNRPNTGRDLFIACTDSPE